MAFFVHGGSPRECIINGRSMVLTNDSEPEVSAGRSELEVEAASQGVYVSQKRSLAGFSGCELVARDGDYEYLIEIWENPQAVNVSLTLASGATYGGQLYPSGELKLPASGKITIEMYGESFPRII